MTVDEKATRTARRSRTALKRPRFESIALLLQGGGALGAYQGGVYEALSEAHLEPDWVAGISIGAMNAALIAGNLPEVRVAKLREFWQLVTQSAPWGDAGVLGIGPGVVGGDFARSLVNQLSAGAALVGGVAVFSPPRSPIAWLQPPGSPEATSHYDTAPLRSTLERLIDFDRINAGQTRFSIGAVNVSTGNFVYFDNTTHKIGPEHVMASGALPPGFPAVEIEGEFYWDGGLVSNTPLQWVLDYSPRQDTLVFQLDLWSARGELTRNLPEVDLRQKETRYSSRTRAATDTFKKLQMARRTAAKLLKKLPNDLLQ